MIMIRPVCQRRSLPCVLVSAWTLICAASAIAQRPEINPGGVVNAASLAADSEWGIVVSPGGIFTIFGRNLAADTAAAQSYPLPVELAGTRVTLSGIPAPLFYVSPNQINFQAPYYGDENNMPRVTLLVTTVSGSSAPVEARTLYTSGVFTQDGSGCGPGAILNVHPDGSVSLNTPANSASPGDFVSVFGTGVAQVFMPPRSGFPAEADPLSRLTGGEVGLGLLGFPPIPSFEILPARFLAPGFAGLVQLNAQLRSDAPEGCAVPLRIGGIQRLSQSVTISIRRGGGACQDPPRTTYGDLRFTKTFTSGPTLGTPVATEDSLEALLISAPQNLVRPGRWPIVLIPLPGRIGVGTYQRYTPPTCPRASGQRLHAGTLTVTGGGNPVAVPPVTRGGESFYESKLPSGTLRAGSVRVAGPGGSDMGAFQTMFALPPPIEITTSLTPGTALARNRPLTVTWRGGTANMNVRLRLVVPTGFWDSYREVAVFGDVGSATLAFAEPPPGLPAFDPPRVEVLVTPLSDETFSAPGLVQPATVTWMYEHRFTGLVWQR